MSVEKRISRRRFLTTSATVASGITLGCGSRTSRPNLLLITLDTTRADRLGCYGYERDTTPTLDALAERSQLFETAIAASSWTLPAHASLFTGKLPTSHGAQYDPLGPLRLTSAISGPSSWDEYRARGLAEDERTLASLLNAAGYQTGAVVGGPWMRRVFGLDRGFDYYDDDQIGTLNGRLASQVTESALGWLASVSRETKDPFFLFLNYYDPHAPYRAPEPFRQKFLSAPLPDGPSERGEEQELSPQTLSELYDGEIAYMDSEIARLLDGCEELGVADGTIVAVTADHGELFGEHGRLGHGTSLYQEEIRVPLLIKPAGGKNPPKRVGTATHQIDVMPMLLTQMGIEIPISVQGTAEPRPRPLVSEVYPLPLASVDGSWQALLARDYKLLKNGDGNDMLFKLNEDPNERDNRIEREPMVAEQMKRYLERHLQALPEPGDAGPPRALDAETEEALRSLGYIR